MIIAQYLTQWLRNKNQKPTPAPQNIGTVSKKDRQILPTVQKWRRPAIRIQDDDRTHGYWLLWRI